MGTIGIIIQTIGMSFVFVILIKIVSFLHKLWLKTALKIRKNYNKKHELHPESGVNTINLSYEMDHIEGSVWAVVLFLIGLLFIQLIPMQKDNLFCIVSTILSIIIFLWCWFARNFGTKKYRILVYIFIGVSLLLVAHIVISLLLGQVVLTGYINSINSLLYIWSTMLMYKLFIDRK